VHTGAVKLIPINQIRLFAHFEKHFRTVLAESEFGNRVAVCGFSDLREFLTYNIGPEMFDGVHRRRYRRWGCIDDDCTAAAVTASLFVAIHGLELSDSRSAACMSALCSCIVDRCHTRSCDHIGVSSINDSHSSRQCEADRSHPGAFSSDYSASCNRVKSIQQLQVSIHTAN
jgi:hypothetical protein